MGLSHSPKIVTNGLVLCLDAANAKSYPGSGNTWTDLSGNGRNGTLTNGPTFSSNNGGSIVLDGSNDYVSLPGNLTTSVLGWTPLGSIGVSTISIEIWFKTSDTAGELYSKPWNGSGGYNLTISRSAFVAGPLHVNYATIKDITYTSLADNVYHQLVCWADSTNIGYNIDGGKLTGSVAHGFVSDNPSGTASNINVSGAIGTLYPYGEGWGGSTGLSVAADISVFKIYNRVLSAAEISQNFKALRGRFGI